MVDILFPVGRMVEGSVYKANTTDFHGKPLTYKTGANAGQPKSEYFFSVAIAKDGRGWWETEWGSQIFQEACKSFRNNETQRPDFAWKITDGDSTTPNRNGTVPNSKQGFAGHWVLKFSSGFQPSLYIVDQATGQAKQLVEENAINTGDFIQVYGNIEGNGNHQNPGVYLNHKGVCFIAYGERINTGPDLTKVGFGAGGQLPPGASATPIGGQFNPGTMPQPPAQQVGPGGYQQPPAQQVGPGGYQQPPAQQVGPGGYQQPPAQQGTAPGNAPAQGAVGITPPAPAMTPNSAPGAMTSPSSVAPPAGNYLQR